MTRRDFTLSIVIPVRPPDEGKSRLAPALDAAARAELVERLFRHALGVALAAAPAGGVHVVSRSPQLLALAAAAGATPIPEQGRGLNPALAQAAATCDPQRPFMALSADLPLVSLSDLHQAAQALADADVVVAADRAGTGTNALLLRRPGLIAPGFGDASLARHRQRAGAAGLRFAVVSLPGLAADLDEPEDLVLLDQASRGGCHGPATSTQRALPRA